VTVVAGWESPDGALALAKLLADDFLFQCFSGVGSVPVWAVVATAHAHVFRCDKYRVGAA